MAQDSVRATAGIGELLNRIPEFAEKLISTLAFHCQLLVARCSLLAGIAGVEVIGPLTLARGIGLLGDWVEGIRRLLRNMNKGQCFPQPKGDAPTVEAPEEPKAEVATRSEAAKAQETPKPELSAMVSPANEIPTRWTSKAEIAYALPCGVRSVPGWLGRALVQVKGSRQWCDHPFWQRARCSEFTL